MRDLAAKVDMGFVRLENQMNTLRSSIASQISNFHSVMESKIKAVETSVESQTSTSKSSIAGQILTVHHVLLGTGFVVIVAVLVGCP